MDSIDNHKIIRRYCQAFVDGDIEALDELVAPDVVDHNGYEGQSSGIEGYREFFRLWKTAFPDLQGEVNVMLADGDLVACRWTGRGTHLGSYHDVEPTGLPVIFTTIAIYRLRGGKIVEDWTEFDNLALLRQLAAVD